MGANKFVVSKPKSDSIAPQLKSCPWCALTFGEKPKVVRALASMVLEFFPHTFFSFTLCSSYIGFLSKLATFPSSSGSIYLLLLLLGSFPTLTSTQIPYSLPGYCLLIPLSDQANLLQENQPICSKPRMCSLLTERQAFPSNYL